MVWFEQYDIQNKKISTICAKVEFTFGIKLLKIDRVEKKIIEDHLIKIKK